MLLHSIFPQLSTHNNFFLGNARMTLLEFEYVHGICFIYVGM